MPWVTWIDIEDESSTREAVRKLFVRTQNKITHKVSDTVRLTSLTPEVSELINDLSIELPIFPASVEKAIRFIRFFQPLPIASCRRASGHDVQKPRCRLCLVRGRGAARLLGHGAESAGEKCSKMNKYSSKLVITAGFFAMLILLLLLMGVWVMTIAGNNARLHAIINQQYDSSRAERELDITFRPIETTLRDTLQWYVDNGWVDEPERLALVAGRAKGVSTA